MRKLYEALSVDVVKFEAQDVITASVELPNGGNNQGFTDPTETPKEPNGDQIVAS